MSVDAVAEPEAGLNPGLDSLLFESSPDCVKLLDLDGHVLAMNRNGQCLMEIEDFSALQRRPWAQLWPAEMQPAIARSVQAARSGRTVRLEAFCPTGKGTPKWWDVTVTPVLDGRGQAVSILSISRDITAHQQAQLQLRDSESRFRAIAEASPQMIWSTRPDGYHDYYNSRWYEFTGMPEGSTDGEAWNGMFHPQDQERAWARWRHCLATGDDYEIEYRLRHRSGEYRWVLGRARPARDEQGRITRWMGTCTDIHEQKTAQEALQRSEESLRQADRRKDEFLAMLAHELRNPLAPIGTAAELLRRSLHDPRRVEQASLIISRQVQHMTDLVSDLLDVSRVTRGLIELDCATFDLKEAVHEAIEQVRPLVEHRRHSLATRLPAVPMWVHGDRTRLIQVLSNLLNNAAKYTRPGGQVTVEASLPSGRAVVQVRDSGEGIDAGLLPHIFELFTQAERSPDRSQGGLGIGLALVRSLVALHGGEIRAESAGKGQGSTFTLSLPAAQPARQERAARGGTAGAALAPRRVVVVDDNADAAETLASLLQAVGHEVRTFGTGEAMLEALPGLEADVFILDIGLPGMTGHEVGRRLRRDPRLGRARIYALSGYGQEQDRAGSQASGFDQHFVKPLDPAVLLATLASTAPTAPAARGSH